MPKDNILPNCLTRNHKADTSRRNVLGAEWFYLFCANCGCDCGRVLDTYLPEQYAFALCDKCAETYGDVAGATPTPFDVFFAKVADAMKEDFGRQLTDLEVAVKIDDSSTLTKLSKEPLIRS